MAYKFVVIINTVLLLARLRVQEQMVINKATHVKRIDYLYDHIYNGHLPILICIVPSLQTLFFLPFSIHFLFAIMNIFVGNLTTVASLTQLRNLFSAFGAVKRVMIIRECRAILPRIFCWIIMKERTDALSAIKNLDHSKFQQEIILVNEAVLIR